MFIGRENELSKLNRMYKSDKFEMAIIQRADLGLPITMMWIGASGESS
mgnify:CR=1 FL=1